MFAKMGFRLDVVKDTTPHQFTVPETSANAAISYSNEKLQMALHTA